ncbi:MAG: hypothetical protein J2P15_08090 [Micromonosporaceae bacterium]|nr:hypothetical protein [Micromonosporaceae bacterium]
MSRRTPITVALALLANLAAACSTPPPTFSGVQVLPVDGVRVAVGGELVDLHQSELTGAVLNGPHYTLHVAWIATGTSLSARDAGTLGTTPMRAAEGDEIVVAGVDPQDLYAPFTGGHVEVTLSVAGKVTPVPQLPLAMPSPPAGGMAAQTEVILISANRGAPLRLRATDAGRSEELDLRTGKVLINSYDRRRSGGLTWSGEATVRANLIGAGRLPTTAAMSVDNAGPAVQGKPVATLTSYAPDQGWAPEGSAILLVPAPKLTVSGLALALYGGVHEQFSDQSVFTFRGSDGRTVRAQPYRRELSMLGAATEGDQTPVAFIVPAGITSGTVTMGLAKAELIDVDHNRRKISWAKAPAPFNLTVAFAS